MLWLFVGPTGVYLLDFFCSGIQFIYCWVLILALSPCYVLICMFLGDGALVGWGSFMQTKCLCVLIRIWVGVGLAPLNRFKPSSKVFYWPFQGGTSFVGLLCFCSVLCLLCFVRVCLYVLRGHLLGGGWPLGSRLWCLLWVCHFPNGILGQVWYLIVSIPDLCNLTYLDTPAIMRRFVIAVSVRLHKD